MALVRCSSFDKGVCGCSADAFADPGTENEDVRCQNGAGKVSNIPKGNQKDAKVSQGTIQNTPWGTGAVKVRKSNQKGRVPWHERGTIFDEHRQKVTFRKIKKTLAKKHGMLKGGAQPKVAKK